MKTQTQLLFRRTQRCMTLAALLGLAALGTVAQAQFAAGNLVVTRFGDGLSAPANQEAVPVFLEEYTTTGAFVQRLALPTTNSGGNHAITGSFNSAAEGALTLSQDGRYLMYAGYNAAPGTLTVPSTPSTTTPRVVARIDGSGSIDTSTLLTDAYSAGSPRSVASTDGTNFWLGGSGANAGVRYSTLGSAGSQQLTNAPTTVRNVNLFDDRLYVSSTSAGAAGINVVGNGLPTSGIQTATLLPGFSNVSGLSSYDFVFATDAANANLYNGANVLYVADDSNSLGGTHGGLQKWGYDGQNWNLEYTLTNGLGASTGLRGLTASFVNGTATLYGITAEGTGLDGSFLPTSLVKITDSLSALSDSGQQFSVLVTSPDNTAFRGVDFAPTAPPVPEPSTTALLLSGSLSGSVWLLRRRRRSTRSL